MRALFGRHAPSDIEDLEILITLGQLEMGASTGDIEADNSKEEREDD